LQGCGVVRHVPRPPRAIGLVTPSGHGRPRPRVRGRPALVAVLAGLQAQATALSSDTTERWLRRPGDPRDGGARRRRCGRFAFVAAIGSARRSGSSSAGFRPTIGRWRSSARVPELILPDTIRNVATCSAIKSRRTHRTCRSRWRPAERPARPRWSDVQRTCAVVVWPGLVSPRIRRSLADLATTADAMGFDTLGRSTTPAAGTTHRDTAEGVVTFVIGERPERPAYVAGCVAEDEASHAGAPPPQSSPVAPAVTASTHATSLRDVPTHGITGHSVRRGARWAWGAGTSTLVPVGPDPRHL
jgi:hypothetical protein